MTADTARRGGLLCRLGLHLSQFGDGCQCWYARRCNRCLRSQPAADADRVDLCRRMVSAHTHPEGPCQGGTGRD